MSADEQSIGKHGEQLAAAVLRGLGVEMVEKIGTPVHTLPAGMVRGKAAYFVIYGEKVSGDFRGVLPGGRSVMAEVKTILSRNLGWSDLRDHQPARLSEHAERGGLSVLVWVHSSGVYALEWPVPGFKRGVGITPEQAEGLRLERIARA